MSMTITAPVPAPAAPPPVAAIQQTAALPDAVDPSAAALAASAVAAPAPVAAPPAAASSSGAASGAAAKDQAATAPRPRAGSVRADPRLEETSVRAMSDLRRARGRMAEILADFPGPAARSTYMLASVAELRAAIVPPAPMSQTRSG